MLGTRMRHAGDSSVLIGWQWTGPALSGRPETLEEWLRLAMTHPVMCDTVGAL